MPQTVTPLPIPPSEILRLQGELPPYGSLLWQSDGMPILVSRIPGPEPDIVNDVEKVAEWASPSDVMAAKACILLTANKVHSMPMQPIREYVEKRISLDRKQALALRHHLGGGLTHKLYRSVDDPYRRVRLGIVLPVSRMRDVDDNLLDEVAAHLKQDLEGGLSDVHCVHLVSQTDDVRLAPDAFLEDMIPRISNDERRLQALQRLQKRQQGDASARGEEIQTLQKKLAKQARVAIAPIHHASEGGIDWDPEEDFISELDEDDRANIQSVDDLNKLQHRRNMHREVDQALESRQNSGVQENQQSHMSRLRRHLARRGYQLQVRPSIQGHQIDLAADRLGREPERIIAWQAPKLDRDMAERALAASRDLHSDLAIVISPAADEEGRRVLVATRVRWITPERIEGLQL